MYLANPYFVPDRGVLRALQRAASRGVDVRLLLPVESDSTVLDLAARAVFGPLLAAGVRIWQSRAVVHTKVLSVDDVFVSIGSYNFDHRSLAYNLEMVVNAVDTRTSADVTAMLESDMAVSEELTRETFGEPPAPGAAAGADRLRVSEVAVDRRGLRSVGRGFAVQDRGANRQTSVGLAADHVGRRLLPDLIAVRGEVGPADLDDGEAVGDPVEAQDVGTGVGDPPRVVLRLGAPERRPGCPCSS